ncbi:MAG: TetR/AcrR family transcriptional regulator [Alphaproteobacteria bacterium]
MKVRDRIIQATKQLAAAKPVGEISLAELSRASGVSWPTVRRHVGGRNGLPRFLKEIGVKEADAFSRSGADIQAVDTRSRILHAAFRTFAEQGYSGATLDDVGAAAGLTKGAVYWHFASKDDLCMALIEERFNRETVRIPGEVHKAARGRRGEKAVAEFVEQEVAGARDTELWRRLEYEFMSRSRDPALRRRYAELVRKFYTDLTPLMQWLIDSGITSKDLDPKALAFTWRCLIHGLRHWMVQDPDGIDFEAMAPQLAHIMWRGMASQSAAEKSMNPGNTAPEDKTQVSK